MGKMLKFHQEALESIGRGVKIVVKALGVTFGPKGQHVIIQKETAAPLSTKEGRRIAQEICLKDRFEHMGASLVKDLILKIEHAVGDGSITAALLIESLFTEGVKQIASGANPLKVKKGIEKGVKKALELLEKSAFAVKTSEIASIATAALHDDSSLGELVAEALQRVGKEGLLFVEESQGGKTFFEIEEGISFDAGYASAYFAQQNMQIEEEEVAIFIADYTLSTAFDCVDFLEEETVKGPVLLIVSDIEKEALSTFVLNQVKRQLSLCIVKAPLIEGEERTRFLHHLAILTGATVLSEEKTERSLSGCAGSAKKVKITKDKTTLIGGGGDPKAIQALADKLRAQIKQAPSLQEKERCKQELAKVIESIGVIYVSAADVEMKERLQKTLATIQRTLSHGALIGGGVAYLHVAQELSSTKFEDRDEQLGLEVVKKALFSPALALANTSGQEGKQIVEKIAQHPEKTFGYHLHAGEFVQNLASVGVIDPLCIATYVLEQAASFVAMLLTISCAIVELPKKEDASVEEVSDES